MVDWVGMNVPSMKRPDVCLGRLYLYNCRLRFSSSRGETLSQRVPSGCQIALNSRWCTTFSCPVLRSVRLWMPNTEYVSMLTAVSSPAVVRCDTKTWQLLHMCLDHSCITLPPLELQEQCAWTGLLWLCCTLVTNDERVTCSFNCVLEPHHREFTTCQCPQGLNSWFVCGWITLV